MCEEKEIWLGSEGYTYIVETSKVRYRICKVVKECHNLIDKTITLIGDTHSFTFEVSGTVWWKEDDNT